MLKITTFFVIGALVLGISASSALAQCGGSSHVSHSRAGVTTSTGTVRHYGYSRGGYSSGRSSQKTPIYLVPKALR